MDEQSTYAQILQKQTDSGLQLPKILGDVEEGVLSQCERLLEKAFLEADDMLYEFALDSSSASLELDYFDTLRDLRVKKGEIIHRTLSVTSHGFCRLVDQTLTLDSHLLENETGLALVSSDGFEQNLALRKTANSEIKRSKASLSKLETRLDHILLETKVDAENNPLDLRRITSAFIKATDDLLDLGANSRGLLFKLFSKEVLQKFSSLVGKANEVLIDTGVLPDLDTPKKSPDPKPSPRSKRPKNGFGQSDDLSLSEAVAALRGMRRGDEANAQLHQLIQAFDGALDDFSFLNQAASQAGLAPVASASNAKPSHALTEQNERPRFESRYDSATGREDAAQAVTDFFDVVMQSEDIPLAARNLISRLQIPVLKEAMVCSDFFTNESHPARRLINKIMSACIYIEQLDTPHQIQIQEEMFVVVNNVARDYRMDQRIFIEAYFLINRLLERD